MSQVKRSNQPTTPPDQQDDLFYGALVTAWLNTRLERDKSILILSAGGVGLLATLMTTVGPHTYVALAMYAVSTAAFMASLVSVLVVFHRNASHLQKVARDPKTRDPMLARLDRLSFWAFVIGAVVLGGLGFMAGVERIHSRMEVSMTNSDQTKTSTPASGDTLKKSFDGISEMRPVQTQQPTTSPPAAPSPAATPAAAPQTNQSAGTTGKK